LAAVSRTAAASASRSGLQGGGVLGAVLLEFGAEHVLLVG